MGWFMGRLVGWRYCCCSKTYSCEQHLGQQKPQGLLRLGILFPTTLKLGPDAAPFVRKEFLARDQSAGSGFDGSAIFEGDRTSSVSPTAYVRRVCADGLCQRSLAATFLREVGFDVHAASV